MSSSISPGTAFSAASATRSTLSRRDALDRRAEHVEDLGVVVVPRPVGAVPPVDQPVGVEDQRRPGRQRPRLLAVARQPDAEQDALVLQLHLARRRRR